MSHSVDSDVMHFKERALETWLPVFSNAQGVESRIKDAVLCESTGRKEESTSPLTFMHSALLTKITFNAKNDDDFKNRKRRNVEAKETFNNSA